MTPYRPNRKYHHFAGKRKTYIDIIPQFILHLLIVLIVAVSKQRHQVRSEVGSAMLPLRDVIVEPYAVLLVVEYLVNGLATQLEATAVQRGLGRLT